MAAIVNISPTEHEQAKAAKFKLKKPKKPKQGATLNAMENWVRRYNVWATKKKAAAKKGASKLNAIKAKQALRAKITSL